MALWWAIFASVGGPTLAGFPREAYLVYALWAAFFARIAVSWMYEFRMIDEIDTGKVNSVLVRPITFYEFYFGQFMGYKILTSWMSFIVPLLVSLFFPDFVHFSRLPLAIGLLIFYLVFVHTLSFLISSLAFFINRAHSITVVKNISLWVLSGELFPLDLVPEPYREWFMATPFRCGVYVPVAYITGRIQSAAVMQGFVTVFVWTIICGVLGTLMWNWGRRMYSGQGA